jgi:Lipocalin-like domain
MKRSAIAAVLAGVAFAGPSVGVAQTAKDVVGTWRNTANVTIAPDGKRTNQFGPNGNGMAIFGADGRFVIVNTNPDTPKFASNGRTGGTADENKAGMAGGIGLYGTYTVAGKAVTMNIEGSTYPNWTKTVQKRDIVRFAPNEFAWGLATSTGGKGEVTWTRIK